jgi:hypothetical protein
MQQYVSARREHAAWQLLASRTAPSVISALQGLFEMRQQDGVELEEAVATLAEVLQSQSTSAGLEVADNDFATEALRELRQWIRRGLVVERRGKILATDALQKAFNFVDSLDNPLMTSTASRLSTVQREIEYLEASLNPNPEGRIRRIERKIKDLEAERDAVKTGQFSVLDGEDAVERIREVYHLAASLRADFRRVEDSYRDADKQLRESIIQDDNHRGDIVQKLLDNHDALLETAEGRVFHNFHQQLGRSVDLDEMSQRLKTILRHKQTDAALSLQQQVEMRWLKTHLVAESQAVIKARAHSERDVRGYIKTGLAAENHRVGQLLQTLLQVAVDVNWTNQTTRRSDSPITPVAVACTSVPTIERLRVKEVQTEEDTPLDLSENYAHLDDLGGEFWSSFDSLDRGALLQDTRDYLNNAEQAVPVSTLAKHFKPQHDLETITLWLSLAREAELPLGTETEEFNLTTQTGERLKYTVPRVDLGGDALKAVDWESFDG